MEIVLQFAKALPDALSDAMSRSLFSLRKGENHQKSMRLALICIFSAYGTLASVSIWDLGCSSMADTDALARLGWGNKK